MIPGWSVKIESEWSVLPSVEFELGLDFYLNRRDI